MPVEKPHATSYALAIATFSLSATFCKRSRSIAIVKNSKNAALRRTSTSTLPFLVLDDVGL